MPETPDQEWRRLTNLYGDMYDGQLLELAASFNDLTEMGRTVLRDEMRKRDLGDPLSSGWSAQQRMQEHEQQALDAADKTVEYTWKVELCECDGWDVVWQLQQMLKRAGIESWKDGPGPDYFLGPSGPRVYVAADQLDHAKQVIAQPIPQDIINESREKIPEYAPPVCPSCGAVDPILISADPSNTWECESCGTEWSDPADDHAEI